MLSCFYTAVPPPPPRFTGGLLPLARRFEVELFLIKSLRLLVALGTRFESLGTSAVNSCRICSELTVFGKQRIQMLVPDVFKVCWCVEVSTFLVKLLQLFLQLLLLRIKP